MKLRLLIFEAMLLLSAFAMRVEYGTQISRFLRLDDQGREIVRHVLQPGMKIHFWIVITSILLTLMILLHVIENAEHRIFGIVVLVLGICVTIYCFSPA